MVKNLNLNLMNLLTEEIINQLIAAQMRDKMQTTTFREETMVVMMGLIMMMVIIGARRDVRDVAIVGHKIST